MSDTFYGPRSRKSARMLLDAAASLGLPARVVRTRTRGYVVPEDVLEAALGSRDIQPGVEYPAPDSEPPRAGSGSSRGAWAEYAKGQGVEVSDEDTRNDIILKVDTHKEGN